MSRLLSRISDFLRRMLCCCLCRKCDRDEDQLEVLETEYQPPGRRQNANLQNVTEEEIRPPQDIQNADQENAAQAEYRPPQDRQNEDQGRNDLDFQERQAREEEELALALVISLAEAELRELQVPPVRNAGSGLEEDEELTLALTISRLENEETEAALAARYGPNERLQLEENISEELQCPVCLELFRRATTLGCGHTFCACCLDEVRGRNGGLCPLCRAPINSATRCVALDNVIKSLVANESES